MRLIFALFVSLAFALPAAAQAVRYEKVVAGVNEPWGLAFLPGGAFLVTERDGRLLHFKDGVQRAVKGVPKVRDVGQGGLLDVMVPRDFATSRQVFLSFAKRQGRGEGTALGVGTLSKDGTQLTNFKVIFEMEPGSKGGRHFGSRIVEGRDGAIYLTIGDRGDRPSAQDLSTEAGSVIRIGRDGRVPSNNPFVGKGQAEIWSFGHRNPQGAALDGQGRLWVVEHGAAGGDELNLVKKGANYGWPVISYGQHYSGRKIGEGTKKPGMEQPAHYWDPSIAPSGLMIYSGKLFPQWKGDAFVGSLKFSLISRLSLKGDTAREVERIKSDATERVRDVREAPDGSIWFLSVGNDAIYRMVPATGG